MTFPEGQFKILILGSNGQLGSSIKDILKKTNHIILARNSKDFNLLNNNYINELKEFMPDIVINCAAFTKVDLAESNKDHAMKVNAYALQNLLDEIKKISDVAHKHNLNMHMDGARFANALVSLNVTPAEMTWKSGIDVLSFGATKNGCLAAEAIIFFKKDLVGNIAFLMKRAGHLLSKMRFVSAQLDAYISNDVWLRNAKHANKMGKRLSEGLSHHSDVKLSYPTEANEVFAKFPRNMIEHLNSEGYKMNEEELDGKSVRLVAAWNTQEEDVDGLLETLKNSN